MPLPTDHADPEAVSGPVNVPLEAPLTTLGTHPQVAGAEASSASSASSTSSKPTLFGSSVHSLSDLAMKSADAHYGPLHCIRTYWHEPTSDLWTPSETPGMAVAVGACVIISFDPNPNAVIAGDYDSVFETFFENVPKGRPTFWTLCHEPEPKIAAGHYTLDEFHSAFDHLVTIADAADNNFCHPTLILQAGDLDKGSPHAPFTQYIPGGDIVRYIGWDRYPPDGEGTPTPSTLFEPAVVASASVDLPFGFSEFGTVTETGRPAWLTEAGAYHAEVGARFSTLFDSGEAGGLGGGGSFLVEDPESITAWREVVAG